MYQAVALGLWSGALFGGAIGAGIGIPGIIDRRTGMLRESPNLTGWHDYPVRDGLRFVQLTPPGSACSIVVGAGITEKAPARTAASNGTSSSAS